MEKEKILFNATLCFLIRGNKVLLGTKTRQIGKDCWNGYGGGVHEGENIRRAAVREVFEETGGENRDRKPHHGIIVLPADLEKVAVLIFHNETEQGKLFTCTMHTFVARKWTGMAVSSTEMIDPTYFPLLNVPYKNMMLADRLWVPDVFAGKKFKREFAYGPRQETLTHIGPAEYVTSFDE